MIPHWESITNEEVKLTTPTQYVMSGSTLGIPGGVQVREMMESSGIGVAVREPIACRKETYNSIVNKG